MAKPFNGGHGGCVIRDGSRQDTCKFTTAAQQRALKAATKARRQPRSAPEQYTPKHRQHTIADINLRVKSRDLIENGNDDALLSGICDFVNMGTSEAHMLLVMAIYLKENGYPFVQEKLGITIPNPDKMFEKLLRELAHQYRTLNKQNNFFKTIYALPEQKDHPINVAYNSISFGNSDGIDTLCARNLATTTCHCFIISNNDYRIGYAWFLLQKHKLANFNWGGLNEIFKSAYSSDESSNISDWLLPLAPQIFNLYKAMVAEEKPEIAKNLCNDPSFYYNHDTVDSVRPDSQQDVIVPEETDKEDTPHEQAVKSKPIKRVKRFDICAHSEVFTTFCASHNSIMEAGIKPPVLVSNQEAISSFLDKCAGFASLNGAHDLLANQTEIMGLYEKAEELRKSDIDPMALTKHADAVTTFFNVVSAVADLGFDITNILEKASKITEILASADEEL